MSAPGAAKVIVDVRAGVIPEVVVEGLCRRWWVTSAEWEAAQASKTDDMALSKLLADVNGRALGYAGLLMLQPDRVNWVRTEWVYL